MKIDYPDIEELDLEIKNIVKKVPKRKTFLENLIYSIENLSREVLIKSSLNYLFLFVSFFIYLILVNNKVEDLKDIKLLKMKILFLPLIYILGLIFHNLKASYYKVDQLTYTTYYSLNEIYAYKVLIISIESFIFQTIINIYFSYKNIININEALSIYIYLALIGVLHLYIFNRVRDIKKTNYILLSIFLLKLIIISLVYEKMLIFLNNISILSYLIILSLLIIKFISEFKNTFKNKGLIIGGSNV